VVAIDAGHGGSPDNSQPEQQFDPGVIGQSGTMEKDVTLDVARRVERRLTTDHVRVVMTRSRDRYVDISGRMEAAIRARAGLFVSIHFNSFTDPTRGGSTVLYPDPQSLPFAQVMSDALGARLPGLGIADDGTQVKDDLWVHAAMPAVTVEGAYLSNAREESLLRSASIRDALAGAIADGVEKQAPAIAQRCAAIAAWDRVHGVAVAKPHPSSPSQDGGHGLRNGLLVLVSMVAVWQRRLVGRGLALLATLLWRLGVRRIDRAGVGTHRRRLRSRRRQTVLERSRRVVPRRSVYDEFSI